MRSCSRCYSKKREGRLCDKELARVGLLKLTCRAVRFPATCAAKSRAPARGSYRIRSELGS